MSDTFFASLPRFDRSGHEYAVCLDEAGNTEDADEAAFDGETADAAVSQKLQALEQTLAELAKLSDQLRAETSQHMQDQLRIIAEKLFPELGRAFLAEEIARHLPDLVPASAPQVEIRAEPELAESLRLLVEESSQLADRCLVLEDEAPGPNRATISWSEGGADFDFSGLLDACLERLKVT